MYLNRCRYQKKELDIELRGGVCGRRAGTLESLKLMVTQVKTSNSLNQAPLPALYAQSDIIRLGGFSKSHLYNLVERRHFPAPVLRMGPRFTRWSAHQCDQWFSDPAGWIKEHASNNAPEVVA